MRGLIENAFRILSKGDAQFYITISAFSIYSYEIVGFTNQLYSLNVSFVRE